jgi:hypothetical protein
MIPKSQAINSTQDLKCLIERIHLKCKFPTKFECGNAHTYFDLVNCYLRVALQNSNQLPHTSISNIMCMNFTQGIQTTRTGHWCPSESRFNTIHTNTIEH